MDKTALTNGGHHETAKTNGDIINGGGKMSWYKDVIELRKKAGEYKVNLRNPAYAFIIYDFTELAKIDLVSWMGCGNSTGHYS